MSVIVKGRNMPRHCGECACSNYYDPIDALLCDFTETQLDEKTWKKERHPDCPLVELPKKHGRLVDADKLADLLSKEKEKVVDEGNLFLCFAVGFAWGFIAKEPTVVEAEGSET